MTTRSLIRTRLLELVTSRGPAKSICPSEVARQLDAGDWRGLMPEVRAVASDLVSEDRVRVTRGGVDVDPLEPGGPIRITIVE